MSVISERNNTVFNHNEQTDMLLEEVHTGMFGPSCARNNIPPPSPNHPLASPPSISYKKGTNPTVTTTSANIYRSRPKNPTLAPSRALQTENPPITQKALQTENPPITQNLRPNIQTKQEEGLSFFEEVGKAILKGIVFFLKALDECNPFVYRRE